MLVDWNFWRRKSVLVTGHTGFKGGWLATWLAEMGADVTGYSLTPATDPSYFSLSGLERKVRSTIGNILDFDHLTRMFSQSTPEVVFHLAAQSLVRRSYMDPSGTFRTNVTGTVNLLEAIRACSSVRCVIIVTSDKCYENNEWVWGYRETDALGGHDPYSASKGCVELVSAAYRCSFFENDHSPVALGTARAGNVIGGGDWSDDRLVPDAVKAFVRGDDLVVRNPTYIRPWQHVLEPLRGYLILARHLYDHGQDYAGPWNFGPRDDDAAPASRLADLIAQCWGGSARWRSETAGHSPHESRYLKLDSSKARALLGWRPQLALRDAVDMTVKWYRAALTEGPADMYEFSCMQILDYERMLRSCQR